RRLALRRRPHRGDHGDGARAAHRAVLRRADAGRAGAARLTRPMSVVAVPSPRIFLLSPANCNGPRAKQVLSPKAQFALAAELRSRRGAMLGDVFMFISGLYFRGKLTYAIRFAAPPESDNPVIGCGVHIITPTAGLRGPDTFVTQKAICGFATGD